MLYPYIVSPAQSSTRLKAATRRKLKKKPFFHGIAHVVLGRLTGLHEVVFVAKFQGLNLRQQLVSSRLFKKEKELVVQLLLNSNFCFISVMT